MRIRLRSWSGLPVVLTLLLVGGAAPRAQAPTDAEAPEAPVVPATEPPAPSAADTPAPSEDAPLGDDRLGHWRLELEQWAAQPSGLNYAPVLVSDPNNPGASVQLGTRHGTSADPRVNVSYGFRDDIGTFSLHYWSSTDQSSFSQFGPGSFVLGESLPPNLFAGVIDDGFADAAEAFAETKTRDLRLDFSRQAFKTARVSARWYFGLRQVDHDRALSARYHALITGLPVALNRPDLDPLPDVVSTTSRFSGRGPEFGFDVEVPLGKRFQISGGIAAAVLRGDVSTQYSSVSRFYGEVDNGVLQFILGPGLGAYLDVWTQMDPNARPQLLQVSAPIGVVNASRTASAQVLDATVTVRYRVWRELEVYLGGRSTRYTDVASEIRPILADSLIIDPTPVSIPGITGLSVKVPVSGVQETPRSVDYEGLFFGLGFRY
jgi:hypothetical protein